MKKITGTFLDEVTWDIPSQNWGKLEWAKEFDTMREAGIDTVIIIRAGLRNECIFSSEVLGAKSDMDLAKLFLDEAERCKMNLFFGSYDPGDLENQFEAWPDRREICEKFLDEVYQRYGDHPAFYGWYVAPETCVATPYTVDLFKQTSEYMKGIDSKKPVLISPYYPSGAYQEDTPEVRHKKFVEDWDKIFSSAPAIDICAFQDGTCCMGQEEFPTLELKEYVEEVARLCKSHNKTMWNNVETFGRNFPIKFPPIDWRVMKKKMEIADPYTEKHITFEFSHFMSPNSMYPSARNLYARYMEAMESNE